MPVSFTVAKHPANPVKFDEDGRTARQVLDSAAREQARKCGEMLQFALDGNQISNTDITAKVLHLIPSNNGFFHSVLTAYNTHHALVIRPDDVWLAILCQFNFFVNANAELLRASFVAHEGTQELLVEDSTLRPLDAGEMARQMVDLVDENTADPTLRAWAMPAFTTTTVHDTTVAAVLLMATVKKYYKLMFGLTGCGIPRVTLDGEKKDWEDILGRLEKLKEYGVETIAWYHLLRPVIARFVAAFDTPDSKGNVDFWSKVVDHHSGSGYHYYSGWVNAFNAFSREGEWLGLALDTTVESTEAPESMSPKTFWKTYRKPEFREDAFVRGVGDGLVLDGTLYHRVDRNDVPPGLAEVDVVLDEYGLKSECLLVAGMIGTRVSSSGDTGLSEEGRDDTVRPAAGWWMFKQNGNTWPLRAEPKQPERTGDGEGEGERKEMPTPSEVLEPEALEPEELEPEALEPRTKSRRTGGLLSMFSTCACTSRGK
ncbi:hypothetical protein DFH06DRAFT_188698 [Mycena polygramma]|nr:hypothetical protein DFH06DRAFT_188698 [Mycena polygramma]